MEQATAFECGCPVVWCRGCIYGVCECYPDDDVSARLCWVCVEAAQS